MVTGPEIDDYIERAIGKGHVSNITLDQRLNPRAAFSLSEKAFIYIEADEPAWRAKRGEYWQCDASTASDFKKARTAWQAEEGREERKLEGSLPRVPPFNIWKWSIIRVVIE